MRNKKKSFIKGVESSFNVMGDGLELRGKDNLKASWHNVGIYYKRALSGNAVRKRFNNRFSSEELETM